MSLFSPQLDDRTFDQLLDEAKRRAALSCPNWTDFSANDPGVVLLELFAYLTETMIYRLNRLPEKVYVEFLRLMGVQLHPPTAAQVELRFTRSESSDDRLPNTAGRRIAIPVGTRVASDRPAGNGEPLQFVTIQPAALEPGEAYVDVWALHCEQVNGELAGRSTGTPGQSILVSRPPILAPAGDERNLIVGVEGDLDEIGMARCREFDGKPFRIWSEVDSFAALGSDSHVYIVDRTDGRITFAPAIQSFHSNSSSRAESLAEIPAAGREIRVWYRCGGGTAGNVAPGRLIVMKDPIPGVSVTNPTAAAGGREAESLPNALLRGPQELHSLSRAVTARDYEQIASGVGGISRARAFTKAQVWRHAEPGTVQVLLVPEVTGLAPDVALTTTILEQNQTVELAQQILHTLDKRRPLGTKVLVNWMRYIVVRVVARVTAFRGEDLDDIARRICRRLDQVISPLPTPRQSTGWPFDQPLRVGRLYEEIFKEPGVKQVERLRLVVDDVPRSLIVSIAADHFQPSTWHVISGKQLYRSTDNGQAWERAAELPDLEPEEQLVRVRTHPGRAGFVAVVTRISGQQTCSRVFVSEDCGETWRSEFRTAFEIYDVTWILRDYQPALFVASTNGLYERDISVGGQLRQLIVGDLSSDLGFWTVAVSTDVHGHPAYVTVAAEECKGVWVSYEGGRSRSFVPIGLEKEDIRVLAVQNDGSRSLFWAGAAVVGNQPGRGCYRWGGPNEKWQQFQVGWIGGSCFGIAVCGRYLLAATYGGGVLRMDTMKKSDEMRWEEPRPDIGLPRRDQAQPFAPVRDVASNPTGKVVMAGGDAGVYRSADQAVGYEFASNSEFTDRVALTENSLFCTGEHEIVVLDEDAIE